MPTDLTLAEALSDPLIGLMLQADGLDKASFADFLGKAARLQLEQKLTDLQERRAEAFYVRLAAHETIQGQARSL
ncbi:hypothetical protein REJC140_03285 [Pseudorhizobium endolithicum]|uniref:Transposase n=1 Tax=Pseudorhizobium endolithicum TaxID=1191678 RepID=A0ABM8PK21_9HYPH|nr:hypothetical protein [Pseudorhizobium endolithicum]CAD7034185.1 hypothetical protein REJC140_03285 [Pseudorhizobium endolithicum]